MRTIMHINAIDKLNLIIKNNGMGIFSPQNKKLLILELSNNSANYDDLVTLINYTQPDIAAELCNSCLLNPIEWEKKVSSLKEVFNGNKDKEIFSTWVDVLAQSIREQKDKLPFAGVKSPNSKIFNIPPNDTPLPTIAVQNQSEQTDNNHANPANNSNINNSPKIIPISDEVVLIDTSNAAHDNLNTDFSTYTKEQLQQKLKEYNDLLTTLEQEKFELSEKENQLNKDWNKYEKQIQDYEDNFNNNKNIKSNTINMTELEKRNKELEPKLEKLLQAEEDFKNYDAEYQKFKNEADKYEQLLKKDS